MLPWRLPLLYEDFAAGLIEAPELDERKNISYAYVWGRVPLHRRGREPAGPESFGAPDALFTAPHLPPAGGFSVSLAAFGARPFFSRVPL